MKKRYLLLTVCTSLALWGQAQVYTTVNAPANPGGVCYYMTQTGQTATAVWADEGIILGSVVTSVTIEREYEVYLGSVANGGEGIAFVFQQEGPAAIGAGGGSLGYGNGGGVTPSVAIEIDTNPQGYESAASNQDHLSLHFQGNHTVFTAGPVTLPNVEDGAYHSFRINWTYSAVTGNSTLTGTFDNTYSISYSFQPSLFFNLSNTIYYGFTAGVSPARTNDQRISFAAPGALGSCSALTFPVELTSFEATPLDNMTVGLSWTTASELNNDYFEVLRANDGALWQIVGTVDGVGTTQEVQQYRYLDLSPNPGRNYYRLRQIDFDGAFGLSDIVEVYADFEGDLRLVAWPNPTSATLHAGVELMQGEAAVALKLFNMNGQEVMVQHLPAGTRTYQQVNFDVSTLPRGLYFLQASAGDYTVVSQVSLQ
ncbi:MAG: T9SS type A sorting domain-containing protein [Bacteroidia bacterium]|nr:T9SS type A sorting domain-containing protein [Bacteroidia bacterium]